MTRHLLRGFRAGLLLASGLALSGCFLWTTKNQGEQLEVRVAKLEEGLREEQERFRTETQKAQAKVAELESVLEQATAVVTRNSADLGLEVQNLRQAFSELEGQLAEARHIAEQLQAHVTEQRSELESRLNAFARRAGIDLAVPESEIPADKGQHFAAGQRAMQAGEYSKGRALFREFVNRYGSDDQADNAQYWIGKSYLLESKPATALGELRRVITQSPKGDVAPDALFDMGDAFYQLHACTDAKAALEALIKTHPRSPLVAKAKEKLQTVQRAPRGYCTQ